MVALQDAHWFMLGMQRVGFELWLSFSGNCESSNVIATTAVLPCKRDWMHEQIHGECNSKALQLLSRCCWFIWQV